jgi:diguanylate cyclase (GGDEF)-like protein/PAS domain S-box-containing protein
MPYFRLLSAEPGIFLLITALFVTGILTFIMSAVAWKYRHVNAAVTFAALTLAAGIYSLGYFLELNSTSIKEVFFWIRLQYFGIAFLPLLWFLFILQYTDRRPSRFWVRGLFLIPLTTITLILTNDMHQLYYRSLALVPVRGIFIVALEEGPWYWVHITYFLVLYALANLFLLEEYLQTSAFFKRRFLVLFGGSLFPGAAFFLYRLEVSPIHFDLIPFGLFLAGLIFLWDLVYYRPFEILPVARASIFNAIQAGLVVLDYQDRIIDINEKAQELFGPVRSLVGKPAAKIMDIYANTYGSGENREQLEWFFDSPKGRQWFDIRSSSIKSHSQKTQGRLLIMQNITQKKEAEAALMESESLKSSIVEAIPDQLVRFNREGYCLDILGETEDTAWPREKMQKRKVEDLWPKALAERFMAAIEAALQTKELQTLEFKLKKHPGSLHYEARIKAYAKNEVVAMIRDITESKRYQEKLEYLSLHDQLTGLYNRAFFEEELQRFSRGRDYPITIISIDVDGLKQVNDTFGHDRGDKLLKAAAGVLKKSLRRGDLLARVGGDEFAVILPRTDAQAGQDAANRIRENIKQHNEKGPDLPLSISIGLATAPEGGKTLAETFKEADNSMYQDKLKHKSA